MELRQRKTTQLLNRLRNPTVNNTANRRNIQKKASIQASPVGKIKKRFRLVPPDILRKTSMLTSPRAPYQVSQSPCIKAKSAIISRPYRIRYKASGVGD